MTSKKAPRDNYGYLFHSLLSPEIGLAPADKLKSLERKVELYTAINGLVDRGLLTEDALTGMMNLIVTYASTDRLPYETLAGWFREEVRAYRKELKGGGFEAIMGTPEAPRPYEEKMHDHFTAAR